ncbi:MAG TPA: hypothetical protein VF647_22710 [Longimicrobium sp.]|jgi:hypothetical protein
MFHPDLTHLARLFLAELLRKNAPNGVQRVLQTLQHFERFLHDRFRFRREPRTFTVEDLTVEVIAAYAVASAKLSSKGMHPQVLRRFYRWGFRRKMPGFREGVLTALNAIQYTRALSGHIVRMAHPTKGAFTWEEEQLIKIRLREGRGRSGDRAIVATFQRLGIRPEAMIRLRRRHLRWRDFPDGRSYFLDVPKVKQRGGLAKEITVERLIDPFLAELLLEVMGEAGENDLIFHWLGGRAKGNIAAALKHWAADAELMTIRHAPLRGKQEGVDATLPTRLHVFSYRFRRTMATNLAVDGATAEEIAAALDDELTAMAAVYTENSAAFVDVLERTLDRHPDWVLVVRMFLGDIASPLDESHPPVYGGVPHFAGYAEFADIGVIGHCDNPELCHKEPPLDCYQCPHFHATRVHAPHERQLVQIDQELRRCRGRESDRMANLLRPQITAIVELLQILTNSRAGLLVRASANSTRT